MSKIFFSITICLMICNYNHLDINKNLNYLNDDEINFPEKDINEIKKKVALISMETGEIPEKVKTYIATILFDYKLPDMNDFIKDINDFTDSKLPFMCSGDFNGSDSIDYAILLIKNEKIFLVILNSDNEGFKHYIVDNYSLSDHKISAFLKVEIKGLLKSIDHNIKIENDYITVELIDESIAWSYYWSNGKYVKILSD